jgi:hypothetical protein
MTAGQPRFPRLRALARATRTLSLYMLLGLITSVLVAWALAAWMPYRSANSVTIVVKEPKTQIQIFNEVDDWHWHSISTWGGVRREGTFNSGTLLSDHSLGDSGNPFEAKTNATSAAFPSTAASSAASHSVTSATA